jgi:hypothetical protein
MLSVLEGGATRREGVATALASRAVGRDGGNLGPAAMDSQVLSEVDQKPEGRRVAAQASAEVDEFVGRFRPLTVT